MNTHLKMFAVIGALSLAGTGHTVVVTNGAVATATVRSCGQATIQQPCQISKLSGGYQSAGGAGASSASVFATQPPSTDILSEGIAGFNADSLPELHALSNAAGNYRTNGSGESYELFTWNGSASTDFSLQTTLDVDQSRAPLRPDSVAAEAAGTGSLGGSAYIQTVSIYSEAEFARFFDASGVFQGATFGASCGSTPGLLGVVTLSGLGTGGAFSVSGSTTACSPGSLTLTSGESIVVDGNLSLFANRDGYLDALNTAKVSFDPALGSQTIANLRQFLTPAAFVPEPASWISILCGFAAIGCCLRRGAGRNRSGIEQVS